MRRLVTTLLAAGLLSAAAPASATILTYTDGGNVWVATPDGANKRAVTANGTTEQTWISPSSDDQGRILASRGGTFFFMDQQGQTLPNGANVAPKDFCGGAAIGPLVSRVNGLGDHIAFQYQCGTTQTVALAYPQSPTVGGNQIDWSNWQAPTWFGNRIVVSDGRAIFIQPATSDPAPPASPDFEGLFQAEGLALTRASIPTAGNRVLLTGYDNVDPYPRFLVLARVPGGIPASTGGTAQPLDEACVVPTAADPTFGDISADGTRIAWVDAEGLKVSATPAYSEGSDACVGGAPVLVAPGGSQPAWGAGTLQAPVTTNPNPGGGGGGGGTSLPPQPSLTVTVGAGPKLARALRKGFPIRFSCSQACTVKGAATVTRAVARRFRLRSRTVAKGAAALTAVGNGRVVMRFPRAARTRLQRARSLKLRLRLTSNLPNVAAVTRALTLRR